MEESNPRTAHDWSEYYEAMESKPLHPNYALVEPHLTAGLRALELGCGIGHGVIHMLGKGLEVVGVDAEEEALDRLMKRLPPGPAPTLVRSNFQSLELEANKFDIVVAGFCLFFLLPVEFEAFWPRVVASLKRGGVFMGQFLGKNDEWADEDHTSHTADEVKGLLEGFEILSWEEAERDGETAMGRPKHWHVFHILARKL